MQDNHANLLLRVVLVHVLNQKECQLVHARNDSLRVHIGVQEIHRLVPKSPALVENLVSLLEVVHQAQGLAEVVPVSKVQA